MLVRWTCRRYRRYAIGARWYDRLSAERPVYRPARLLALDRAQLRPGDAVLDIGCGTGLNLPPVAAAIGPGGRYVGLDASAAMLAGVHAKARAVGDVAVRTVTADAATVADVLSDTRPFDVVLFTYTLSVIADWRAALDRAVGLVRPGGRVVVVDMSWPTGRWRVFAPLVALAFVVGGVHPSRAPWNRVARHCTDVRHEVVRGGHIHIVTGTVTG